MNTYVVLFESHTPDEAAIVNTDVEVYSSRENAVKALEDGIYQELADSNYDENDVKIVRDGDGYVSFCTKDTDDWFFRITVYERKMRMN